MKFNLRAEAKFCAAHFLQDYKGKCNRLHGHNYKVIAHITFKDNSNNGMCVDFKKLKSVLKNVVDEMDHKTLIPEIISKCNIITQNIIMFGQYQFPRKDVFFFPYRNTTAENIAKFIFEVLYERFDFGFEGMEVEVFETDTNSCRYTGCSKQKA